MSFRVFSRRELLFVGETNPEFSLQAPRVNKKEIKRERISQETIVTIRGFRVSFTNKNRSRSLIEDTRNFSIYSLLTHWIALLALHKVVQMLWLSSYYCVTMSFVCIVVFCLTSFVCAVVF